MSGTCSVADCTALISCRGWCEKHYYRWRRHGDPTVVKQTGVRADPDRKYKNGDYLSVRIPDHPAANGWGLVLEHRVVMERKLGRYLVAGENVHHINGVRHDNRPENLELWNTCQPPGQRVEDKVAWAKEILAAYEPEALNDEHGSMQRCVSCGWHGRLSIEPERMSIVRGV